MGLQLKLKLYNMMRKGGILREVQKPQLDVHLRKMEFKDVEKFVYLGVRVTCKFEDEKEVE